MTDGWNAQDYARHSKGQQRWARELIGRLCLAGNERVLDIGCGDGKVTAEIAEHLPQGEVVGIDSAPSMIDLARKTFPPARHSNLRFERMDAQALDFEESFDVVFSNAVLHWVPDHQAVVEGVRRVLRPGGRLLFSMGGAGNAADVLAVLDTMIQQTKWRAYFEDFVFPYNFSDDASWRRLLTDAGFVDVRAQLVPKDMVHDDIEAFAGWIRTTWHPYVNRVPETMRPALIGQFVDDWLTRHPLDEQGRVHVEMVRLEVEARRPDA